MSEVKLTILYEGKDCMKECPHLTAGPYSEGYYCVLFGRPITGMLRCLECQLATAREE